MIGHVHTPDMTFRAFLESSARNARDKTQGELKIVIGNTSCDLDSCVSSLALAYYYSCMSDEKETFVPVINCNKEDFGLKLENKLHIVDENKIPMESLYFMDELVADHGLTNVKETILVDHNILD